MKQVPVLKHNYYYSAYCMQSNNAVMGICYGIHIYHRCPVNIFYFHPLNDVTHLNIHRSSGQ